MSTSKNKPLIFIIITLLLTNIGVLGYFLWFKKTPPKKDNNPQTWMINALQKDVGFTDQQIAQYKELNEEHWKRLKPMFEDIRKSKDSLFKLLSDETVSDSVINKKAETIAQKQKAIDLQAFNNFKRIRTVCTSQEQRVKYDSLVQRLMRKMNKPKGGDQKKETVQKKEEKK
jgi:periplasmic protein CpxP/Spy